MIIYYFMIMKMIYYKNLLNKKTILNILKNFNKNSLKIISLFFELIRFFLRIEQ